jgi:hypothetical protein
MALGDAEVFSVARGSICTSRRVRISLALRCMAGQSSFSAGPMQILADENIFGDREFVEQHGFLVNGGDPDLMRRLRRSADG